MGSSCCIKQKCGLGATKYSVISIIKKSQPNRIERPCLNFKPFHAVSLEGSPVTVGISHEQLVVRRHFSFFISQFQSRVTCRNLP